MKNKCIIIGGSNGIGLTIAQKLQREFKEILIFDIKKPAIILQNTRYIGFDLSKEDLNEYNGEFLDTDALIITAGIGRVSSFENLSLAEIEKTIKIDFVSSIKAIKLFYPVLQKGEEIYCMIFGSLAGDISSPLFSVYGACKAAINKFIESLNVELIKSESSNRILCVKPISFAGSSFNGQQTDLSLLDDLATNSIKKMFERSEMYIPMYREICSNILARYNANPTEFGMSSFDYKVENKRILDRKMIKVGYLSGTFDLFHIGHLNLLKRAKQYCDYLIVGIHPDASHKGKETYISFEERKEIVKSIKYVDKVVDSCKEDSDAWDLYHYDYLFVGSDYKGTDRFNRYEEYFSNKNVKIIYFEYTKGTSSTQLREILQKKL